MKKISKLYSVILLVFTFFSFFNIQQSFAACSADAVCCPCTTGCLNGLSCVDKQCQEPGKTTFCSFSRNNDITKLIDKVSSWMLVIALVLVPLMILFGGFYMLTAAGDTKRSTKGKQTIMWASIALAIFLFVKAFVSILRYFIGF